MMLMGSNDVYDGEGTCYEHLKDLLISGLFKSMHRLENSEL